MSSFYTLQFDGCSKGNPGRAGAGALLLSPDGQEIWCGGQPLRSATNNEAEYTGLLVGLHEAITQRHITHLVVQGDSQLVLRQLEGRYQCRAANLIPLLQQAKHLLQQCQEVRVQHVLRHLNARADALANEFQFRS